jgi:hypothetical protein
MMLTETSTRAFAFLVLGLFPARLTAQQVLPPAILYGSVLTNPGSRPIAAAEVRVGPTLYTRTDSAGAFTIRGIPAGVYQVVVRHFGNQPIATQLSFSPGDTLGRNFMLSVAAQDVDTVRVVGSSTDPVELGKMAGFAERRTKNAGLFLDTLVFQKEQWRRLGEILRSYRLGMVIQYGSSAAIASRSGAVTFRQLPHGDATDQRRGAKPACYSQVIVDGVRLYEPSGSNSLFDLNSVSTNALQGAEFYSGPSSTPAEYGGASASCGTLLLWTK